MMAVDRLGLTPQNVKPFMNTKHELIKAFCDKYINDSNIIPYMDTMNHRRPTF